MPDPAPYSLTLENNRSPCQLFEIIIRATPELRILYYPLLLEFDSHYQNSLLFLAVSGGYLEALEILIKLGFNPKATRATDENLLHNDNFLVNVIL